MVQLICTPCHAELEKSLRVVYFLRAGHKQIVIFLCPTVAGLLAFNLISTQFTVPIDIITVLLKTALETVRPVNVWLTFTRLFKNAHKTATFPPFLQFQNWHLFLTGTVYVLPVIRLYLVSVMFNLNWLSVSVLFFRVVILACTYSSGQNKVPTAE